MVREYTIYEEPINQSNGGHNSSNDGHNSSMVVKKEYEYKKGVEEEGVKNTCPNDIIVIALESSTDSVSTAHTFLNYCRHMHALLLYQLQCYFHVEKYFILLKKKTTNHVHSFRKSKIFQFYNYDCLII